MSWSQVKEERREGEHAHTHTHTKQKKGANEIDSLKSSLADKLKLNCSLCVHFNLDFFMKKTKRNACV